MRSNIRTPDETKETLTRESRVRGRPGLSDFIAAHVISGMAKAMAAAFPFRRSEWVTG